MALVAENLGSENRGVGRDKAFRPDQGGGWRWLANRELALIGSCWIAGFCGCSLPSYRRGPPVSSTQGCEGLALIGFRHPVVPYR